MSIENITLRIIEISNELMKEQNPVVRAKLESEALALESQLYLTAQN